ncbi:cell division protein FtsZ [Salinibacillus kushneri]|uniref:Cell division protein FtsZ n=1 Tax=Salinibacillus kushneri TaxID=237682 RepID=A0A1I0CMC0_9BACI|nr:hypothetical protein [Salinibacillus kushneri]SET20729.1 cell division protein FtsZ [Salinibacillus kushneri]
MKNDVAIYKLKHSQFEKDYYQYAPHMNQDDFCFYHFVGGDPNETDKLIEQLHTIKNERVLLLGIFRFPFQFEGKKRLETAIHQYYHMKEICDTVAFFHGEGMLHMIQSDTTVVEANKFFNSLEDELVEALENMVSIPGEMNIDVQDIKHFITQSDGPLFLHTIERDSFDQPLKNLISAPYLPDNYADGKQMILNIGYTQGVDMEAYRQINLRLHDMFHKADLVKLGSYYINKPGKQFKITLLVNGIEDPFPKPEHFSKTSTSTTALWFKKKWEGLFKKGKEGKSADKSSPAALTHNHHSLGQEEKA